MLARDGGGELFGAVRRELGETMNTHLAVYRDEDGMRAAFEKLSDLRARFDKVVVHDKGKVFNTNLIFTLELGFMLDCAEAIILGALERKESRGAHTRTDMPDRDDENWLKHILISRTEDGETAVDYLPVTITQWEPQVRSY